MAEDEIYFELVQVGQQIRVAAIDASTGIEVVVVMPLTASRQQMQQLALAKLRRQLGEATDGVAPTPLANRGKFA